MLEQDIDDKVLIQSIHKLLLSLKDKMRGWNQIFPCLIGIKTRPGDDNVYVQDSSLPGRSLITGFASHMD